MELLQGSITTIIPVYNGEQYLKTTIKSVLDSSYEKLEVLLIDDGSTDKSSEICKDFVKKDNRVRYIRQENRGIVAARNKGLELARGEYVCFCDQDDLTDRRMYDEILQKMQSENAQIGLCSTGQLLNGERIPYEHLEDAVYREEEVRCNLLYPMLFRGYDYPYAESANYLYGTIWKCIFRREFLDVYHIKFRRFIDYEDDWIFMAEAFSYASCAVSCGFQGYYWRINKASKSHGKSYIQDIIGKMELYNSYVYGFLADCIVDKAIFKEYIRISLCEHFVDLYRNEASLKERKEKKAYHKAVGEYLRKVDYRTQLACRKHLRKSAFRRRFIYGSLWYFGISVTFYTSRVVDILEGIMGNIRALVLLDRKAKKV